MIYEWFKMCEHMKSSWFKHEVKPIDPKGEDQLVYKGPR